MHRPSGRPRWTPRAALVACVGAACAACAAAGCAPRATPPAAAPIVHLVDVAPARARAAPPVAKAARLDLPLEPAAWSAAPPGEIVPPGAQGGTGSAAAPTLAARAAGADVIAFSPKMSIRAEEWEEIDVTYRVIGAPGVEIFWRGADEPQINPKTRVALEVAAGAAGGAGAVAGATRDAAGGDWRTVRLPKSRLKRWRGTIAQFALRVPVPPGGGEARLEVREFALRDRTAAFADSANGVARYEMDGLSRPVVYAHAPASIEYDVAFPERAAFTCGAGVLPGRGAARLRATLLDHRGRRVASAGADAAPDGRWAEIALAIPEGLARGRIRLEAEPGPGAPSGGVAFWANPIVFARNATRRPDVVVYLIDCLRSDRVGAAGHAAGLTPEIDRFARDAVTFADAYSNATWTRPSLASIMTSVYPSGHGVRTIGDRLPGSFTTLAERLAAAGYETVAFTSNPNSGPPASLEQGFERMYLHGMSRGDDKYGTDLAYLREWLGARGDAERPAFVFIHTIECHGPYLPPEPYASLFAPAGAPSLDPEILYEPVRPKSGVTARDLAFLSARWDATAHLADGNFGAALDALGPRADDAYLFLISDHGESLGEHGVFGHDGAPFEEQIRVPFYVRPPRGARAASARAGAIVRGNVQLVDLAPTALDLLGLAGGGAGGTTVGAAIRTVGATAVADRAVFSEQTSRPAVAVIDGARKLVVRPGAAPDAPLLTDLASDPTESASRRTDDPELLRLIDAWASTQRAILDSAGGGAAAAGPDSHGVMDAETEERLRALGYIK